MDNKVVLGLQWGDEGKGKVIDLLAGTFDYVVRCQGGANAGHTVVVDGKQTVLHLLPSGALHEDVHCIIGNGVVVDPTALKSELADLGAAGASLAQRLSVSDRAHLVLPYHKLIDAAIENRKGDKKVGTTLRGIGPCYADKIARTGLRCGDIQSAEFSDILTEHCQAAADQLNAWGQECFVVEEMVAEAQAACNDMADFVCDTAAILHRARMEQKNMLFEGAQGIMLDIDYGTFPYVTSSNTGIGGVITGSGLCHKSVGDVIGILKAYTTRVGEGCFPVELLGEEGEALRQAGGEFGATTGRPRRCGWLDLVVAAYSCRLNGVDTIALTKLDVLSGRKELPVCVAYESNGQRIDTVPSRNQDMLAITPVYETLPGWNEDISACRSFDALPAAAQDYVHFIEERVGVKVGYIGVGPGREETITR